MKSESGSYKLIVIGDSTSGKSSLLHRFMYNRFEKYSNSTVCASFFTKTCTSGHRINMWDTAGQEKYRSIIKMYFKDIDIVLFVYDITQRASYDHLKDYWIKYVEQEATSRCSIQKNSYLPDAKIPETTLILPFHAILIGNKMDLKKRKVSAREGAAFARSLGIPFIETSALDNTNVEHTWDTIQKLLLDIPLNDPSNDVLEMARSIVLSPVKNFKDKCTC